MCRPSGTRLVTLCLPGTSVPGYRLRAGSAGLLLIPGFLPVVGRKGVIEPVRLRARRHSPRWMQQPEPATGVPGLFDGCRNKEVPKSLP